MKKSTLLTVASVGAVALTSAMTFAAWDNLEATTESQVKFTQVDVTQETQLSLEKDTGRTLDSNPTATGTMVVKINDTGNEFNSNNTQLSITPEVTIGGELVNNVDVKIYKGDSAEIANLLVDNVDNQPTYDAATYTVVVKPNADAAADDIADKPVTVKLTSTLSEKTTPAS